VAEEPVFDAEGYLSGDGECFCLAVTAEEFARVKGKPPKDYDRNFYCEGLFNLYPYTGESGVMVRYRVFIDEVESSDGEAV
jgi:hypothetical protein